MHRVVRSAGSRSFWGLCFMTGIIVRLLVVLFGLSYGYSAVRKMRSRGGKPARPARYEQSGGAAGIKSAAKAIPYNLNSGSG